jgi:outer membrane lipoprotein-sorting protein
MEADLKKETKKTIKFSETYFKMPNYNGKPITKAVLLEVLRIKTEDLHNRFVEYDTSYFDEKEKTTAYYKLPKGEVLVLLLKSYNENGDKEELWTTIRRYTPQKYEYYKKARGEDFKIEITKELK